MRCFIQVKLPKGCASKHTPAGRLPLTLSGLAYRERVPWDVDCRVQAPMHQRYQRHTSPAILSHRVCLSVNCACYLTVQVDLRPGATVGSTSVTPEGFEPSCLSAAFFKKATSAIPSRSRIMVHSALYHESECAVLKTSRESLRAAISSSLSIRQVLQKCGLKPAGGNYNTVRKLIRDEKLDTSHFLGQGANRGKHTPRRPTLDYLNNKAPINSYKLKNRLIREGIMEHRCMSCKLTTWLGKPIPVELHHRDGNKDNNTLSNLELLCHNCHSFTPNFRGKAIKKHQFHHKAIR